MPPRTIPPPQHSAAMLPALRGPACSSQPPQIAAEMPSMAMNISKMWVSLGTDQLQLVVKSSAMKLWEAQAVALVAGSSRVIGSQNTENP